MRAAYIETLGPPEDIRVGELELGPRPPGHTTIAVEHVAVNRVDTLVRSGQFRTNLPWPCVLGRDAIGYVTDTDERSDFFPGTRVWTSSLAHDGRQGAAAEWAHVPDDRLYPAPEGVTGTDLLAVAHPGSTAYLAVVRHGRVQPGDRVLIRGAAGNVGSAAIAIASYLGASTIVAVASEAHHAACVDNGATDVVDYTGESADDQLATVARRVGGFDLWIDAHGGNNLDAAVENLRLNGRIVLLAGPASVSTLASGSLYLKDGSVKGFVISRAEPHDLRAAAGLVSLLVARGRLSPVAITYGELSDLPRIHRMIEAGELSRTRSVIRVT
ncbi:zinc-binding dehydrogenase [Brevibacterium picturae]|uniref:NADPH:quinone reductase n=1 Tax=Brevibacterium picturae TaxID=260553 RepID=A0ABN2B457_9MICO